MARLLTVEKLNNHELNANKIKRIKMQQEITGTPLTTAKSLTIELFPYNVEYDVKEWVSKFASISRNKEASNNPHKRYELLLKETASGGPSRPLELEPVVINNSNKVIPEHLMKFASRVVGSYVMLNRRCVIENPFLTEYEMHSNVGVVKDILQSFSILRITTKHSVWDKLTMGLDSSLVTIAQSNRYTNVEFDESVLDKPSILFDDLDLGVNGMLSKSFIIAGDKTKLAEISQQLISNSVTYNYISKVNQHDENVVSVTLPKFVADQIVTHKTLNVKMSRTFSIYYPYDLENRVLEYDGEDTLGLRDLSKRWDDKFDDNSASDLLDLEPINVIQDYFKAIGYPKEIYQRYPHHARMVRITLDKNVKKEYWEHFFIERGGIEDESGKNHTQDISKYYAKKIYDLYHS